MFITFEGIDGCGKSTQLKILNEFLVSKNIKTLVIREPGGTILSERIRDILLSKSVDMTDLSELLLFAAARNSLVEKVIKPALTNGIYVLSDRFYDSTSAYQGYGRGIDKEKISLINNLATDGLKPDLTFYLKIPLEIAQKRSKKREKDRIESAGTNFFENVIRGYEMISIQEPNRFKVIDAKGSIRYTHNLILNYMKNNSQ